MSAQLPGDLPTLLEAVRELVSCEHANAAPIMDILLCPNCGALRMQGPDHVWFFPSRLDALRATFGVR